MMAIVGHSQGRGDMNRRYDIVDVAELLTAVDRLGVFWGFVNQNVDQWEATS
jgi:hypothetical protein